MIILTNYSLRIVVKMRGNGIRVRYVGSFPQQRGGVTIKNKLVVEGLLKYMSAE